MQLIERLDELFTLAGRTAYEDERREAVSGLAHALQCAQLAEWAQATDTLVAAALLHDIGHYVDIDPRQDPLDDVHELRAIPILRGSFSADVLEPIRLHVQAKRYLVATSRGYGEQLSAASQHSLALQGGAMGKDECGLFEALPFAAEAVMLRRWDDQAKVPQKQTPPLAYYLPLLHTLTSHALAPTPPRTVVGAFDA